MTALPARPQVFLDFRSNDDHLGQITIELFSDKCPKTCQNFYQISTSSFFAHPPGKSLTYEGSPLHRVIDEFMIQGGDITAGNGTGGTSIYGGEFEDENIGWRKIDKAGLVCMANRGKGTNSSQFFITLAPCEHLNAKHTVFGHVLKGMDVCQKIAKVSVDKKDRPLMDIVISNCGDVQSTSQQNPGQTFSKGRNQSHQQYNRRFRSSTRSLRTSSSSRSRSRDRRNRQDAPLSRRRSDVGTDETRRGRAPVRSPPKDRDSLTLRRHPNHKRASPPSRSSSPKWSRSPHLRRRITDRDVSPRSGISRRQRASDRRAQKSWRPRDDDHYDGRKSYREPSREERGYESRQFDRSRHYSRLERDDGSKSNDADYTGVPPIKFKGRGSMKYTG